MEAATTKPWKDSRIWLLTGALLLVWHLWMTLTLFGQQNGWENLQNDAPILSGRHPLHLYHGTLGARSFLKNQGLTCYDPSFQAGYPKTPVFDASSRPAEFSLILSQGRFSPRNYKRNLAICSLLIPVLLTVVTANLGWGRRCRFFTALLGSLVWWSGPCRGLLEEGEFDLLMGTISALLAIALLIRYHREPTVRHWFFLILVAAYGWFTHPTLFVVLFPLLLIYYLSVGTRHRPAWHVLLGCAVTLPLVCNLFWLVDWVEFWWIRMPLQVSEEVLPHRTPGTFWRSAIWGASSDRALALVLFFAGCGGIVYLNETGHRPTARVMGLGMLGLCVLAFGGILNRTLGRFSTSMLFVPALFFAVPLTAIGLEGLIKLLGQSRSRSWSALCVCGLLLIGLMMLDGGPQKYWQRVTSTQPFTVGISAEQQDIIQAIQTHTNTQARILWQELPNAEQNNWTCLLPLLTDRAYFGGLDSTECIEHTVGGLTQDSLKGQPLSAWSLRRFQEYCRRYNIGWIVCWSDPMKKQLQSWNQEQGKESQLSFAQVAFESRPSAKVPLTIYRLNRDYSYTLQGRAEWLQAEVNHIALRNVQPQDGTVTLCLHYLKGMRVSPSRVKIERAELDAQNMIPLVRLRMDAPVSRLDIIWE